MFFSTKIFGMAGLNAENAQFATLAMGTVNVAMTVVSLFLVEKAGRKTLLLIGFIGMFVDTLLLAVCITYAVSIRLRLSQARIVCFFGKDGTNVGPHQNLCLKGSTDLRLNSYKGYLFLLGVPPWLETIEREHIRGAELNFKNPLGCGLSGQDEQKLQTLRVIRMGFAIYTGSGAAPTDWSTQKQQTAVSIVNMMVAGLFLESSRPIHCPEVPICCAGKSHNSHISIFYVSGVLRSDFVHQYSSRDDLRDNVRGGSWFDPVVPRL